MSLSEISIKKPVFAWMLMVAMILFGYLAFREMGVSQLPDVDFPTVNISVSYSGASPEVLESDVVDLIESSMMTVEGVENISSSIKRGSANVTLEFNLDRDIDQAVNDVQTKLAQITRRLPKDIDAPSVSKTNPDDQPIMWMAVSSENLDQKKLMAFVRDHIKDRFLTTPGVADVFLSGYVDPAVRIWVNEKKLDQFQLTVGDIVSTVSAEHAEIPSGLIENSKSEFSVRTLGEAKTIEEFQNLSINRRGGAINYSPIPLKSIADVELGLEDIRRKSRVLGKTSIGLGIRKQKGTNAVDVAKAVKAKMDEVNRTLPSGTTVGVNFDSTTFVEESVHELTFTLILSAVLTAVVCWAFLGSWSATFNVILAIPTSVLGSFVALYALGFTLNYFTLLGLSLAIGIVVDDAIMVLENIFRHFEMGKDKRSASLDGAKEITFAAMAATVAIIAIFFPIAYMKGIIGKYFYQFAVTISVAVFLSLIEALTLTPMRCAQFMSHSEKRSRVGLILDKLFERFENFYKSLLPWILDHRFITIFISVILFGASLFVVPKLRKEFTPAQDQSGMMIRVKTKEGSSLEYTDQYTKKVEAYLLKKPEIKRYFAAIGGFGGGESSSSMFFITLKDKKERNKSQQELIEIYRNELKEIKGGRVIVQDTSLSSFAGGGRGFPVEFAIAGSNWADLTSSTQKIMKALEDSKKFMDVDSNFRESVKELNIIPNREKARLRGVAISDIGTTINALVGGPSIGKFTSEGHRYEVRVKLKDLTADHIDRIAGIKLRNNRGELIALKEVAEIKFEDGIQAITRENRLRAVTIYANIAKGYSQQDALKDARLMAQKNAMPGIVVQESGSAKTFRESFESLIFVLVLGVVIAYMVLASQFNSFVDPITVLTALPFSISGAFLALYVKDLSINIYSMIGIVLLMGIVKKNSILLVDFTNQMRDEGMGIREALLEACPKRLRPILMTSFATIAGAIPPAFSFGPGAESLAPMSMAVIGGVFVSTFLTLLVVPAFYSLLTFKKREGLS